LFSLIFQYNDTWKEDWFKVVNQSWPSLKGAEIDEPVARLLMAKSKEVRLEFLI
jgi:hypothetical protein